MDKGILRFISRHISAAPIHVDRLVVSSFARLNDISIKKNLFLKEYLISNESPEELEILNSFISLFTGNTFGFEELIEIFEFVVSPEEKVVTGAIFTPKRIREYIIDNTITKIQSSSSLPMVCDPACGCSGFLYSAATKINQQTGLSFSEIFEKSLFGLDIQGYSVNRSKLLLSLLALSNGEDKEEFRFNIFQGNALDFQWSKKINNFRGFSHILGNPPYVCSRNIDIESKKLLKNWSVCATGHPDLYIPFFEIGISLLKEKGVLGFITMNSFFKSLNGRSLREYFAKERLNIRILDFGANQIFKQKSTYTCICIIEKIIADEIYYKQLGKHEIDLETTIHLNPIPYGSLNSEHGWNLKEYQILNKIESIGKPLGKLFKSRNGIATLKNKLYIFDSIKEDERYYYLQNGSIYPIEKGICKEIINPNKLINNGSINKIKRKVIFPYVINNNNNISLIKESEFLSKYPKAYEYLHAHKSILATRDKGNGNYSNWYAYGRNQSLEKLKYKLFFPHITPKIPNFVINSDDDLLFHNGLALIGDSKDELKFLKKLLSSRLFWFYITNSSRHYGSEYYSLSKNYFKNFGVFDFTEDEKKYIIKEKNWGKLNSFIEGKYELQLSSEEI